MDIERNIAVLDANEEELWELCDLLEKRHCQPIPLHSLAELEIYLNEYSILAVLMDIDSIPLDNRTIRELTVRHPEVYFLCISIDRFHPDLKDAICYHIYACLNKPVDPDELFFWLRSIHEEEANSKT